MSSDTDATVPPTSSSATRVLADGTYATETVFSDTSAANRAANLEKILAANKPPLRALILGGDFYTAAVLAGCLTKLVLRFSEIVAGNAEGEKRGNEIRAEVMMSFLMRRVHVLKIDDRRC